MAGSRSCSNSDPDGSEDMDISESNSEQDSPIPLSPTVHPAELLSGVDMDSSSTIQVSEAESALSTISRELFSSDGLPNDDAGTNKTDVLPQAKAPKPVPRRAMTEWEYELYLCKAISPSDPEDDLMAAREQPDVSPPPSPDQIPEIFNKYRDPEHPCKKRTASNESTDSQASTPRKHHKRQKDS